MPDPTRLSSQSNQGAQERSVLYLLLLSTMGYRVSVYYAVLHYKLISEASLIS